MNAQLPQRAKTSHFNDVSLIEIVRPLVAVATLLLVFVCMPLQAQDSVPEKISFANQVRPILAAKCFGCHQGNIDRGSYVMTDFNSMLAGGDSGDRAIVPGKPEDSQLLVAIEQHDGEAEMPPNDAPVSAENFKLIQQWIAEGAENDYQSNITIYSQKNPPSYFRQPFTTSLDVSPDGSLIAISGLHEVLLLRSPSAERLNSDAILNGEIVHRLIGLSARVESVRFSPDGKRLAVAGGNPAEYGEVQVWDVGSGQLQISKTVSFDTVYGVNWSHDGRLISFGCTDTTVRCIESDTGKQVLFQGAHDDWVRDTVFSVDSKHLVSVGRDMSCKLIEVETERFVDNITSITPGVLKGGIASVARHPQRDEVVIGGSDGIPKLYRMNRLTKRVIGDDANLIRKFPEIPGRINSVSISADGKRMAAASSLDGKGFIAVYSLEFDTAQPENIKAIVSKVVNQQSAEEKKKLADYVNSKEAALFQAEVPHPIYSIEFSPDQSWVVVGGSEGVLRFFDLETSEALAHLFPIPPDSFSTSGIKQNHWKFSHLERPKVKSNSGQRFAEMEAVELLVSPKAISFLRPTEYTQLVIQAKQSDGTLVDVTHEATVRMDDANIATANGSLVEANQNGQTMLTVTLGAISESVPVSVQFGKDSFHPNFIRDVNPVLTKLGCNAGTCHGSQAGRKGFKLSLRGYDPIYDIRSFTDELGSRRVNITAAEQSLMLMKPASVVPHEGGQLFAEGDKYYSLIRQWIADGALLDLETPRVAKIDLLPSGPALAGKNAQQQMRVVATYTDGTKTDVTQEAVIEMGDIEIGRVDGSQVTALRRGESPILARFEGAFTSTTMTVMGDRSGFQWVQPETWSTVDEMVASKWQRLKIQPSGLCDDTEFLRRIYLDLTGLPPTPENVASFLADERPTREKRNALIDALIGNDDFIEHWSNKWADLMQVNRKYLGAEGAGALRNWVRKQVRENRPYDEFAYEILTASGSNKDNPPASYFKIHRNPEDAMENTTHLFLATRFNCNKCHDHPFERWTQDQYYETAAFFAQIGRAADPQSGGKKIGGSAVEGATPLFELITDRQEGEIEHVRTGNVVEPKFPFEAEHQTAETASRRERLAAWITSKENPYFATSYVNRLWGYLMGVGLIEPLDDIRAGNPASNPELLEYLKNEFISSGFDTRHVIRLICQSRTYQLSVETNRFNQDDLVNYSHALARRLPAEVLFDSIHAVTGSELKIPGVPAGTRAAALPDSGAKLPSGFLSTLGRPARESVCECERTNELQLGSVLAFVSGPDLAKAINNPNNAIAKLVETEKDDSALVNQLFLRVLNRSATNEEIELALASFDEIKQDHVDLVRQRDERKAWFEAERGSLEAKRSDAIKEAKASLVQSIETHDKKLLAKESARITAIAKAEKELSDYTAKAATLEMWIGKHRSEVQWHPLAIDRFESKVGRTFTVRPDRSVLLSVDKPGKDEGLAYTKTDLTGVSYLRLEVLKDATLPNKGPGLAENGNFVINEFEVEMADPLEPDQWKPVALEKAHVDFSQAGFSAGALIDGKKTKSGWAIVPNVGQTHWATFRFKTPVGYSQGTLLRFRFTQHHDDQHQLGCFRLSVSRFPGRLGLGLTEELVAELAQPFAKLTKARQDYFKDLAKKDDQKMVALQQKVANAKKTVKVHPEIEKQRKRLARMEQPVPVDSLLAELERNVLQSQKQLENERLTAAQDLTWALINSPSFLFNH